MLKMLGLAWDVKQPKLKPAAAPPEVSVDQLAPVASGDD